MKMRTGLFPENGRLFEVDEFNYKDKHVYLSMIKYSATINYTILSKYLSSRTQLAQSNMTERIFTFSDISDARKEFPQSEDAFFRVDGLADDISAQSSAVAVLAAGQLKGLINQNDCAELRIYLDYENGEAEGNVYLVGINSKGRVMADDDHNLLVSPRGREVTEQIRIKDATPHFTILQKLEQSANPERGFKASFSTQVVEALMEKGETVTVSTVRLPHPPPLDTFFRSTTLSTSAGGETSSSNSLISLLPCPPNCAGGYPPNE